MDHQENHTSPRKPVAGGGGGNGNGSNSDRLKRDEWSEGAVSSLLEAYEEKWILRNRAKLKGQDWEDVAKYVSARGSSTKSPKTQTQCKNKIESMKKRYRSESASSAAEASSSWPLYTRLDLLLRGNSHPPPPPLLPLPPPQLAPLVIHEPPPHPQPVHHRPAAPPTQGTNVAEQNSHDSNGFDHRARPKEDGGGCPNLSNNQEYGKDAAIETDDSSTPAIYSDKEKLRSKNMKMRIEKKKHRRDTCAIAESIRLLAEVVVRSEQARMDTMRDLEKMRAETEAKRGEMDLKRTEIIANTQLEIAKLFAGIHNAASTSNRGADPSLRIGRN